LKPSSKNARVVTLALAVAVGVAVFFWLAKDEAPLDAGKNPPVPPVATSVASVSNPPPVSASGLVPKSAAPAGFQLRPFTVAKETATHQWTAENGRDTNVIRQLAHNDLEYQRMVAENDRIQRRQLVYREDTAAAILQRTRLSGEPVKQLTLPGLDGQELQFTVNRADLEPSWQAGTFTGQLANRPNSMVTLAFKFGRESFTVVSPDDGIYLQAWPREPGEVIITSFDPDVYTAMPEGEPIKTTNTFKIAQ